MSLIATTTPSRIAPAGNPGFRGMAQVRARTGRRRTVATDGIVGDGSAKAGDTPVIAVRAAASGAMARRRALWMGGRVA